MPRALPFAAAVLVPAAAALAGPILETEPNNTPATADFIGAFDIPGGSELVDGSIVPGDVDFFEFTVSGPTQFVAATFGIPDSTVGDSILTLLAADGVTIIEQDDDDGIALFSALEAIIPAGTYFVAVTGFPDFGNTGAHEQEFVYKLVIGMNIVPAPASIAMFGLAGLFAGRRRR